MPIPTGSQRRKVTVALVWNEAAGRFLKECPLKIAVLVACGLLLTVAGLRGQNGPVQSVGPLRAVLHPRTQLDTHPRPKRSEKMLGRRRDDGYASDANTAAANDIQAFSPALLSTFPDLPLWLTGPADLRKAVCQAIHPGLKREPLEAPWIQGGRAGGANNTSLPPPAPGGQPGDDIPVIALSHDNPTHLLGMVRFLRCYGVANITVYDTGSTLPLHLELLDALEHVVAVRRQPTNEGPRSFFNASNFADLPRFFALTDADLRPHPDLPPNFLAYLAALTQAFPGNKAGFALDLTMRTQFIQGGYEGTVPVSQWEARYWTRCLPAPRGASADELYNAPIDTTFAVYDKNVYMPEPGGAVSFRTHGVRVGGTFTATHVPWLCYATMAYLSAAELDFVDNDESKWSTSGRLARANMNKFGNVCGEKQSQEKIEQHR